MGRNLTRTSGARVALYSHDTQGLGHLRRNQALAETLATERGCSVLVISGASEAAAFPQSEGVDCLALPAVTKSLDGRYKPRSLGSGLSTLLDLRAQAIKAALASFQPDVLVADKVPLGLGGELRPALELLSARESCRVVLGLRDVLDDPQAVRAEWERDRCAAALRRFYDAIWIYGDPRVYDPLSEYRIPPDIAALATFTGYIDRRSTDLDAEPVEVPEAPYALCLVGGGQDGYALAESFVSAALERDVPAVVVTGPFMPLARCRSLEQRAARAGRTRVVRFTPALGSLIDRAERVVGMGGYNTVCELVARGKRSLIVPRVQPRREQLIRARRMRELGLLDLLHPGALSSSALGDWLQHAPERRPRMQPDFGGLPAVSRLTDELLASARKEPVHAA